MEVDAVDLSVLRQSPDVEAISENRTVSIAPNQGEPLYAGQAEAAYGAAQTATSSSGYSGRGQTIVILDTGVDARHPDLYGKVVHEACFSSSSPNYGLTSMCPDRVPRLQGAGSAVPCDDGNAGTCGHGTHVAGIAAGRTFGVAKSANIIAIQVFQWALCKDENGKQFYCVKSSDADWLKALEFVYNDLRHQYRIASVNMSFGGGLFGGHCDTASVYTIDAKRLIDGLNSYGITTVIASGNDNNRFAVSQPGCISSAVTVGAIDGYGQVYQEADGKFGSNSSGALDLLAPGVDIWSSKLGGGYIQQTGTSMAAPYVAGSYAILKEAAPAADVNTLFNALSRSGTPVTDQRGNGITRPGVSINSIGQALGYLLQ